MVTATPTASAANMYDILSRRPGFRQHLQRRIETLCGRGPTTFHTIELVLYIGRAGALQMSLVSLADAFALSPATMRRTIQRLEGLQLLKVTNKYFRNGAQSPNVYSLHLENLCNLLDEISDSPVGQQESAETHVDAPLCAATPPVLADDTLAMQSEEVVKLPPLPDPPAPPPVPEVPAPLPKSAASFLNEWLTMTDKLAAEGLTNPEQVVAAAQKFGRTTKDFHDAIITIRSNPKLWGTNALMQFALYGSVPDPDSISVNDSTRAETIREECLKAGEMRSANHLVVTNTICSRLARAGLAHLILREEVAKAAQLRLHSRRPSSTN